MISLAPPVILESVRVRASLGAVLLIALTGGCKKQDTNTYAPPPPPEVIVAAPAERDVVSYLNYTGTVEASETVELRARIQGFLEQINFKPGQRVRKGEILFVIDKRQYQAAVEQADASLQAQKAALEGAENDARLARELADQRAGPEIDAVIKAARRDSIRAEVARAAAELVSARINLEYCEVTAPIDGRITRNLVDAGNLVGRGEPTLLASIVQATPCYVSLDFSESDVLAIRRERLQSGGPGAAAPSQPAPEPGQVAPGQARTCELALADEAEFRTKGSVDYVAPSIDTETGTLRVRARFDNPDESLLPGFFVRLRFPMSTSRALLVPDAALLSDQQGRYALIVNAKDEVEVRRVKAGPLEGPQRVVQEGLTASDRVIVLGVLKARPGAKVTPKLEEPPPPPPPAASAPASTPAPAPAPAR